MLENYSGVTILDVKIKCEINTNINSIYKHITNHKYINSTLNKII